MNELRAKADTWVTLTTVVSQRFLRRDRYGPRGALIRDFRGHFGKRDFCGPSTSSWPWVAEMHRCALLLVPGAPCRRVKSSTALQKTAMARARKLEKMDGEKKGASRQALPRVSMALRCSCTYRISAEAERGGADHQV